MGLELGIGVGLSLLEIIRLMVVMDDRGNRSVQQRKKNIYVNLTINLFCSGKYVLMIESFRILALDSLYPYI